MFMILWLVGQWRDGALWECQGVFSTEAKAIRACRTPDYFIAPLTLDEELPAETIVLPGVRYPLASES